MRLEEALDIEGAAELNESVFSSKDLTVNFSCTADITADRIEMYATHREMCPRRRHRVPCAYSANREATARGRASG